MGTTFQVVPKQGLVSVLMTQRAWSSPNLPELARDFTTSVCAVIKYCPIEESG